MSKSDFLPFATGSGALVETQSEYEAEPSTSQGFQVGIADPAKANKVFRQANFVAASIAQFIVNQLDIDVLDDGNLAEFVQNLTDALVHLFFSKMFHLYTGHGDPNGQQAGQAGTIGNSPDLYEDIDSGDLYVCTTTGDASGAGWTLVSAQPSEGGVIQVGGVTADHITTWAGNNAIKDPGVALADLARITGAWTNGHIPFWQTNAFADSGASLRNVVLWGGTSAGTANAQTVTTVPDVDTIDPPSLLMFIAGLTNTGVAPFTINPNGINNIAVKKPSPTGPVQLDAGDITATNLIALAHDGTQYQLVLSAPTGNVSGGGGGGGVAAWGKTTVQLTNAPGAPNTALRIQATSIGLSNSAGATVVCPSIDQVIDFTINGANALDVGTRGNSTGYYAHIISDGQGNFAAIGSLSRTAPTLPGAYSFFATVGWVPTDSAGNFYRVRKRDKRLQYDLTAGSNTVDWPLVKIGPFSGDLTVCGVSGSLLPPDVINVTWLLRSISVDSDEILELYPAGLPNNPAFRWRSMPGNANMVGQAQFAPNSVGKIGLHFEDVEATLRIIGFDTEY